MAGSKQRVGLAGGRWPSVRPRRGHQGNARRHFRADRKIGWFIDCPPRLSLVSFAALLASDGVVIPMEAADWGAQGIVQVTEAVAYVRRHHNAGLEPLCYLVSRFKRARAYQQSDLRQLKEHFGELAFDTLVPDRARFEQSVTDRAPITLHATRSEAADIARRLFDEIGRRAERLGSRGRAGGPEDVPGMGAFAAGHWGRHQRHRP